MIYTIGSATNLASQLPWGVLLDRYGPRICSTISSSCVMFGFILLSIATPQSTSLYMVAVVFIGGVCVDTLSHHNMSSQAWEYGVSRGWTSGRELVWSL